MSTKAKGTKATTKRGQQIAIDVLRKIERDCTRGLLGQRQYALHSEWRDRKGEQDNIVHRAISKLQDPAQLEQFCAILTDYISCSHIGERNIDAYESKAA